MTLGKEIIKNNDPDWLENIDLDELEKLAAIGYTPEKIAMYYKINQEDFMHYFHMPDNKLKYHYDRGLLLFEAKDGIEMMKDSLKGNLVQSQRLDKLRKKIAFKEAIRKNFHGDEEI